MIAYVTCTDCTYVYIYICYLLLSSCFLFFIIISLVVKYEEYSIVKKSVRV